MKQIMRPLASSIAAVVWVFAFHSQHVQAADKEYLQAVEADVAEFSTNVFEISPDSPWVASLSPTSSSVGQGEGLAGFSDFIKSKSPGSFIFYKKLPDEYKNRLHQDYLATGDLDRIKDDIFRYTKEVKKSR